MPESSPEDEGEPTTWEARQERLMRRAIASAFKEIGLDASEVFEIQKDMAMLRRDRLTRESLTVKVIGVMLGALVMAGVSFVVTSIQDFVAR